MNNNFLDSLHIQGFRAFQSLEIDKLSQVNLIVGKNNSGKTTVLEALRLYFSQIDRYSLYDLLLSRDEFSFRLRRDDGSVPGALALESLFYGRPILNSSRVAFSIGPKLTRIGLPELAVSFAWLLRTVEDDDGLVRYRPAEERDAIALSEQQDALPGLRITHGERSFYVPMSQMGPLNRPVSFRQRRPEQDSRPILVSSSGLSNEDVGRYWDSVALTEDEDEIIESLRVIFNSIEKLVLVQAPPNRPRGFDRIMMAKIKQFAEPVPFKTLGEGMNHLLGIFLALANAKNGVILIDEVENGVHYSVQPQLWRLILTQAAKWNIQVFATTHSWDCVEGFSVAATERRDVGSELIRLERHEGFVEGIGFSPAELEVARREHIEVR
ncbi:MAG: AAA family ATPase [Pseudomonadota bacterium]